MRKAPATQPWTKHYGLPQIPIIITNPDAAVQVREDGVRGRCRVAKACDIDWERVTQWRWDGPAGSRSDQTKEPEEMSYKECIAERQRLGADRTRMEKALMAAKRSQDAVAVRSWGHRIQALTQRASVVKVRQHEMAQKANRDSLKRAAQDILPPDLLRKLYDRANAIEEAMLR